MENWNEFLRSLIGDENQIESLRRWMGLLLSGNTPGKLLYLVSPGPSGKGVLTSVLTLLVGEEKTVIGLPRMSDPLSVSVLKQKRLIVLHNEFKPIGRICSDLKSILGGELLVAREKYQKHEDMFVSTCAIVCSSNRDLFDKDPALYSRILRIDMHTPDTRRADMFSLLCKEIDEIKLWTLAGVQDR